jgi:hypothetical protein
MCNFDYCIGKQEKKVPYLLCLDELKSLNCENKWFAVSENEYFRSSINPNIYLNKHPLLGTKTLHNAACVAEITK